MTTQPKAAQRTTQAHAAAADARARAASVLDQLDDEDLVPGSTPIRRAAPAPVTAARPGMEAATEVVTGEKNKGGRKALENRKLVRTRHSVALNANERDRIDNVAKALAQAAPRAGFSEAVRLLVEVGLRFAERDSVLAQLARTPESQWVDTVLTLSGLSANK